MFYTYIIISESSGKLYIDQTWDLTERVNRHNSNRNVSTSQKGPWKLIFFKEFISRQDALIFEKKLKSMKNKEYFLRKLEAKELRNISVVPRQVGSVVPIHLDLIHTKNKALRDILRVPYSFGIHEFHTLNYQKGYSYA